MTQPNHSKNLYSHLEQLRTEALEELIYSDFNGLGLQDDELIFAALEVLKARKSKENELPDVTAAWEEFNHEYRHLEKPLYPTGNMEQDLSKHTSFTRKQKSLRTVLIAAALVALFVAMMTVPVLGYANVFQMVAHWTAEQFSFSTTATLQQSKTSKSIPKEYAELQAELEKCGITTLTVPTYVPEGFQCGKPYLSIQEETNKIRFLLSYLRNDDYITSYIIYGCDSIFEKDDIPVEIYEHNNIQYYIFSNLDENLVVWNIDGVEYSIGTTLSILDLKEIINSIC